MFDCGCHGHMKRNVHASKNDCGGMVVRCIGANRQFCSQPEICSSSICTRCPDFLPADHTWTLCNSCKHARQVILVKVHCQVLTSKGGVANQLFIMHDILPPIFTRCAASSTAWLLTKPNLDLVQQLVCVMLLTRQAGVGTST